MKKNKKICYCFFKSIDGAQNFWIEKYKRQRIKRNVLASKLRPVKTFRGEKIAQQPNVTGVAIYDKDPPLTTSVW